MQLWPSFLGHRKIPVQFPWICTSLTIFSTFAWSSLGSSAPWGLAFGRKHNLLIFWTHFCERDMDVNSAVNNKSGTCLLSLCWCWVQLSHSSFPKQISHFLFYLTASCISFLFLPGLWPLAASPISSSLIEQIVCLVTCSHLTYPYFTSHLSVTGLFHSSVSPALTSLSAMAAYIHESPFLCVCYLSCLSLLSSLQLLSVLHYHFMLHSPP